MAGDKGVMSSQAAEKRGVVPRRFIAPLPDGQVADTQAELSVARESAISSLTAVVTNLEHIGKIERAALAASEARCDLLDLDRQAKQLTLDKIMRLRTEEQQALRAARAENLGLRSKLAACTGAWWCEALRCGDAAGLY